MSPRPDRTNVRAARSPQPPPGHPQTPAATRKGPAPEGTGHPHEKDGTAMNDSHPVLTSTKGAVLILEAAAAEGLPAPRHIGIIGDSVDIQMRAPEDVQAWATWQEGPNGAVVVSRGTTNPVPDSNPVFHDYAGTMFDQRFKVYAVTYDAADRFPVGVSA